jgi:hypothetical protein
MTAQETLQLFALYGPGGSEFEDRRIIDMMDEIPPITGKMQASRFLDRCASSTANRTTIEH